MEHYEKLHKFIILHTSSYKQITITLFLQNKLHSLTDIIS